jgi:hypothetical protein
MPSQLRFDIGVEIDTIQLISQSDVSQQYLQATKPAAVKPGPYRQGLTTLYSITPVHESE